MSPIIDMGKVRHVGATALSLLVVSCGGVGTDDDVSIDQLAQLIAEPETRIGHMDDPSVGFSRVGGVDLDTDGNLYVMEMSVPEIRVYDAGGTLVRRIGRRGEGPGEFDAMFIPQFGIVGDTLWTMESFRRNLTLFNRAGDVLSTARVEGVEVLLPSGIGRILPQQMRADGKFTGHFAVVSSSANTSPSGVQPTDSIPWPFVLFDATGAVTDTIGWVAKPPPRMWRPPSEDDSGGYQSIEVDGRRMSVPGPPSRLPLWQALVDGYVSVEFPVPSSAVDGVFSVTRFGVEGDTIFHRVFHYEPTMYTAAELDSIAARAARGAAGGMVPYNPMTIGTTPVPENVDAITQALRSAMNFPEFHVPVASVFLGNDESVWVSLWAGDSADTRRIVLDSTGRVRGELTLPSNVRVVWAEGDSFWAIVPDEVDVPWLVRYGIRTD